MARESLDDRMKNGALAPRWKQLVARNKEINDLKGDVDGPMADYDKNLKSAADLDSQMHGAYAALALTAGKANAERAKAVDAHQKALEKLNKDTHDGWNKLGGQADKLAKTDVGAALDIVSKLVDGNDNYVQQANEIRDGIGEAWDDYDDALQSAYDDARKDVDGLQAQRKKLEDDCNRLDDTIGKTITDMQKQAIKANQDKLADALAGFLKAL
jgi:hypothetical protein